jgi:CHAT domain-containing protein/tetratricopeptide (TPR) repeat protein
VRRAALIGLLLVSIAACAPPPERRLQQLYESATAQLWRGELIDATAAAGEGGALAARSAAPWVWRFKLLQAEIRLVSRQLSEAAALLNDSPPETAGFEWIVAKHRYLRGQLTLLRGKPDEAVAILDEASRLAQRASAVDVSLDVGAMKGQALIAQRRWDETEATLAHTIESARQHGDRYHEAVALVNLGTAHLFRNRFDHALQSFERVLDFKELEPQLVYSVALTNAGVCYHRLGEVDRAIDAHRRAVSSHERPGRPRVYYARALGELGTTYLVKGDAANAIAYFRRALAVGTEAGLTTEVASWATNVTLARIRLEEWQLAQEANDEARRLGNDRPELAGYLASNSAEIALGLGRTDEAAHLFRESLALAKDRPSLLWSVHEGLGRLAVAEKKPAEAERHFETALGVIERTRSDLLKADYRLSFLTRLLGFYQQYIDLLVAQGKTDRALAVADSSRARVLAERHGISAPVRATPAALQRVAAQLDATLLFYWLGTQSYAWQVTADRIRLVPLAVNASRADALVQSYQRSIVTALIDPLSAASSPGDEIYATLVAPVAQGIPHGARIVIVPDGALSRLNFETLPVPGPRRHYWIEDVEVAIAPSLGTLGADARPAGVKQNRSVLLIGDPVSSDPAFPPLKYASVEMSAVSKAFSERTSVYRADQATPARYREAKPDQFGMVHFAAHASANAESPLDSAVILSKDATGYKLYARDVAEQPLSAELVTISACRSAGERTYAGEGLVGFAWAFLRAGAQRVIAGLWDVDDRSTADLMGRVYGDIAQGQSPSAALRAAKLAFIAQGGAASKPYYWGPFQLFIGSRVVP